MLQRCPPPNRGGLSVSIEQLQALTENAELSDTLSSASEQVRMQNAFISDAMLQDSVLSICDD